MSKGEAKKEMRPDVPFEQVVTIGTWHCSFLVGFLPRCIVYSVV